MVFGRKQVNIMKKVLILSNTDRLPISNSIKESNDIVIFRHDGAFKQKDDVFEVIVDHSNHRNNGTIFYSQDLADWV